jgi:hypothetical protein
MPWWGFKDFRIDNNGLVRFAGNDGGFEGDCFARLS